VYASAAQVLAEARDTTASDQVVAARQELAQARKVLLAAVRATPSSAGALLAAFEQRWLT
jgi:hypothetical protein